MNLDAISGRLARCAAVAATALMLHAAPAGAQGARGNPTQLVDQIVAIINDEVVTRSELDERTSQTIADLRRQGTPAPPRDLLEKQVLERMIFETVQVQSAKDVGLRIDDFQVDRAMGRIAEQNNMTLPQFRERLEREGMPLAKFREQVRKELLFSRLREREVDSRIQVSEGEVDNFLAEQSSAPASAVELNLAHILVRMPEGASPEQIARQRARAEDVMRQIRTGGDFAKLAATYSDAPEALRGGELGFRPQDRLPQVFADATANLRPGEVAPLIQSPNGFHILKLLERRGSGGASPGAVRQTRARHILLRVNEVVSTQDAQRRLSDLRERIANGTKFEDMARQYSVDASASQGGDLGWLYPGDTVPEFERAMDALKVGEVSRPIESPFGWHLIQVTDRRNQDVSVERQRLIAKQTLRERKSDDAYQEWLRQLRDRAYVEIRTEEK